jgi:hypothetical protein
MCNIWSATFKAVLLKAAVLKYSESVDPLTILYTLEDPLPLQHVYTCLHINIKHRSKANISLAPAIPKFPSVKGRTTYKERQKKATYCY